MKNQKEAGSQFKIPDGYVAGSVGLNTEGLLVPKLTQST
jgi:hypothetical protein